MSFTSSLYVMHALLTVASVDGQICTFFGMIGTISLATSEFSFMKRSYASEIYSPSRKWNQLLISTYLLC